MGWESTSKSRDQGSPTPSEQVVPSRVWSSGTSSICRLTGIEGFQTFLELTEVS